LPFSAPSSVLSSSTTSMPAVAAAWAMPAPIMPAPSMPIFVYFCVGTSCGRRASLFASCMAKNRLRIMFFASGLRTRLTK
jgi:hypothetical protein